MHCEGHADYLLPCQQDFSEFFPSGCGSLYADIPGIVQNIGCWDEGRGPGNGRDQTCTETHSYTT